MYAGYVCNARSEVLIAVIVEMTALRVVVLLIVLEFASVQRNKLLPSCTMQTNGECSSETSIIF